MNTVASTATGLNEILDLVKRYHPSPDVALIEKAFLFSAEQHGGQVRASGEPYLIHLIEVAKLTAALKLDVPSVVSGLLHDTLEDCALTFRDISSRFGEDIAQIVEGVTKLTRIEFESREEKQAENFRKMLIAMAKDIRVVLVKLCDRLHNMRTLDSLTDDKQIRIAQETLDIYAPLANRLGIHWIKSELEDLSLKYLKPKIYADILAEFENTHGEREAYLEDTSREIQDALRESGVSGSVKGRSKHTYSIWRKMEAHNLRFGEIYDLVGFRIIVPTLRACYETLGIVHAKWKPIPSRFKDFIAMPKPNMYQSLHTSVIGPGGRRIEIQIRTPEMNRVAEEGIAAHWKYKEGGSGGNSGFDLQWVRDLVETQQYLKNPDEFIQSVKGDLFPEEVFIFTPRGDLLRLPFGSTPVDFAFAVHSDVGCRAVGAKVNGAMVPLGHKLENGDTVEILTSKTQSPNKDWLRFVATSKAKQRIRAELRIQERAKSLELGREILSKDLRKVKLSLGKLEKSGDLLKFCEPLGYRSVDELLVDIGYGRLSTSKVIARALPETADREVEERLKTDSSALEQIFEKAARSSRQKIGVVVSGAEDVLVRFAKCCEPLPGDRITGFITRGRGVTVHLANCGQILHSDPLRKVDVSWDDAQRDSHRRIWITVHSHDQKGLLANVSAAITAKGVNISSAQIKTTEYGKAITTFELDIRDSSELQAICRAIEFVPGVTKVERVRGKGEG